MWWVLVLVGLVFISFWIIGRRYDKKYRTRHKFTKKAIAFAAISMGAISAGILFLSLEVPR